MATKKPRAAAIPQDPVDQEDRVSERERTADDLLKTTRTTFSSASRRVRQRATDKETTRATHIIERAWRMRNAKNIYSSRWWEYERTWKMVEDTRSDEDKWRANLPDTMAVAAIKTFESIYIDSEVVPVFGRNENDDLTRASDQRDLYVDVSKKGDLRFQLYLARKDAGKLGTGFLFVYPEKDTRIRWEIESFDPKTEEVKYTRKIVDVFDDPRSVRVSPYLVLIDEQARADFRGTARDACLIEIIPREEAQLRYAHLVGGLEAFDERVPSTQTLKAISVGELQNRGIATTANNNTRDVSAHIYTFFAPIELAVNMVEVLHYFCVRPEDSYELLINGQPIFVKTDTQPSPMPWIHKEIPLIPIRFDLYSGDEFWGRGIIELSRADSRANKQYREMMNDRQRLSLFSPVFTDVNDEIDQRLLKLKPLAIIRTRGGVPTPFKVGGITSADLQISADHAASLKRATGIDDSMIGGGNAELLGGRRLTATAIAFMRQSLFLRLKDFQFIYKTALIDEVRMKMKLLEQYYASPLKQAQHLKNEPGLQQLANQVRQFNVKVGDVYMRKNVSSTLFNGPIEHIDLDMEVLMPLTPAEQITKWSQVIRDTVPFIEAGVLDLDLEKMMGKYLSALDVNMDALRKDPDAEAISMADGEHALLVATQTSRTYFEKIGKDGTPSQFLTAKHLQRHQQLIKAMGPDEKPDQECFKRLIAHIAKDVQNYEKKMQDQAKKQQNLSKLSGSLSDLGAPSQGGGPGGKPPSVSMNYKDAPPDVQRQIEEEAGYHPSQEPPQRHGKTKPVNLPNARRGAASAVAGGNPDDMPGLLRENAPSMD